MSTKTKVESLGLEKPRFISIKKDSVKKDHKWYKVVSIAKKSDPRRNGDSFDSGSNVLGVNFKKLPLKYTFGVELETESGVFEGRPFLPLMAKFDSSISGWEYNTKILQGDEGLEALAQIMWVMAQTHTVNSKCGMHVHFGGEVPTDLEFYKAFYIAANSIENEMFSLVNKSRRNNTYCGRIGGDISLMNKSGAFSTTNLITPNFVGNCYGPDGHTYLSAYEQYLADANSSFVSKNTIHKGRWVHADNMFSALRHGGPKRTIEFRLHHGSIDFNEAHSWILICMGVLEWTKRNTKEIMENHKDLKIDVSLTTIMSEIYGGHVLNYVLNNMAERKEKFK